MNNKNVSDLSGTFIKFKNILKKGLHNLTGHDWKANIV